MNNKVKAVLITGILVGLISLGCREQSKPAPAKEEPTYLVMGKRFIYGPSQSYYIEYQLIGPSGEVVAQCIDPKADGTGCEKYKPMESYAFTKDKTERFLVESYDHIGPNHRQDGRAIFENVPGVYLRIKSEGFWSDQAKTSDSPTDPSKDISFSAAGAAYIVLRTGERLHVAGYQLLGDKYRLQLQGGWVDVQTADVLKIEPEEVFTPVVADPPTKETATQIQAPRRPDLSGLTLSERQSIEAACSSAKYREGPAAYNRCLVQQLEQLKKNR